MPHVRLGIAWALATFVAIAAGIVRRRHLVRDRRRPRRRPGLPHLEASSPTAGRTRGHRRRRDPAPRRRRQRRRPRRGRPRRLPGRLLLPARPAAGPAARPSPSSSRSASASRPRRPSSSAASASSRPSSSSAWSASMTPAHSWSAPARPARGRDRPPASPSSPRSPSRPPPSSSRPSAASSPWLLGALAAALAPLGPDRRPRTHRRRQGAACPRSGASTHCSLLGPIWAAAASPSSARRLEADLEQDVQHRGEHEAADDRVAVRLQVLPRSARCRCRRTHRARSARAGR